MHWNSKEGIILTSALIVLTILITIFIHNSINKAIEKKALQLGGSKSEIDSFSSFVSNNQVAETVPQIVQKTVPQVTMETPPPPPPIGSGKRWTPL